MVTMKSGDVSGETGGNRRDVLGQEGVSADAYM